MSNVITFPPVGANAAWRAARNEAVAAYDAWCAAELADKADAYIVYRAAADREEAAVTVLLLDADHAAGDLAAAA
jgi:hypothetical protein